MRRCPRFRDAEQFAQRPGSEAANRLPPARGDSGTTARMRKAITAGDVQASIIHHQGQGVTRQNITIRPIIGLSAVAGIAVRRPSSRRDFAGHDSTTSATPSTIRRPFPGRQEEQAPADCRGCTAKWRRQVEAEDEDTQRHGAGAASIVSGPAERRSFAPLRKEQCDDVGHLRPDGFVDGRQSALEEPPSESIIADRETIGQESPSPRRRTSTTSKAAASLAIGSAAGVPPPSCCRR